MNWLSIEKEYQQIIKDNTRFMDEWAWLDYTYITMKKDVDSSWNELSVNEKRIKRIIWNKILSKSILNIEFEESIVDLYESIIYILDKIELIEFTHIHITRLKAYLYLQQCNINALKNTKQIESLYYDEIKAVIYDCRFSDLDSFFICDLNILYLERKLEIAKKNLELKPK